ncbi:MAG: S8 family serine peptidase, partial [Bdellovibrionota bacterium]
MQWVRLYGIKCLGLLVLGLSLNAAQADDSFNIKLEKTPTLYRSLKLKEAPAETTLYFNDPYYKKQSFFTRIRAEAAYTVLYATTPTSSARVGIIDQGSIDSSNPELVGKILAGSDVGSNINHGQFVLGIMAASSNNSFGISGVAGAHSEFLYKSLPLVDKKPNAALIAEYIREFGRLGFDAVNLSFAIERECTTRNPDGGNCYHAIVASSVVRTAILETARDYNTIFVVSAGNSSQPLPSYTTPENGVLVVGAATKSLEVADYTNSGPGVDIYVAEQGIYGLSKKSVSSPQT